MNRRKITVAFEVTDESTMDDRLLARHLGGYVAGVDLGFEARGVVGDLESAMSEAIRVSTCRQVDPNCVGLLPGISVESAASRGPEDQT